MSPRSRRLDSTEAPDERWRCRIATRIRASSSGISVRTRPTRGAIFRSFSPIALLLFVGSALVLAGLLIGTWVVARSLAGAPQASAGTVLLAVTPFLTGVPLLTQALTLDIAATPK